ncbi:MULTISPECIES: hypothetical protein [Actinosynnema]|uniref:hypothetical protein n=1 Tax=Actinosynnema TaxID=40566 RepID=UPI0020A4E9DA|nr:hypothetical protein [Actinosynnema pretiosum]MCP2094472.1 hypothetical protein [Actinosynnema pretiosum]
MEAQPRSPFPPWLTAALALSALPVTGPGEQGLLGVGRVDLSLTWPGPLVLVLLLVATGAAVAFARHWPWLLLMGVMWKVPLLLWAFWPTDHPSAAVLGLSAGGGALVVVGALAAATALDRGAPALVGAVVGALLLSALPTPRSAVVDLVLLLVALLGGVLAVAGARAPLPEPLTDRARRLGFLAALLPLVLAATEHLVNLGVDAPDGEFAPVASTAAGVLVALLAAGAALAVTRGALLRTAACAVLLAALANPIDSALRQVENPWQPALLALVVGVAVARTRWSALTAVALSAVLAVSVLLSGPLPGSPTAQGDQVLPPWLLLALAVAAAVTAVAGVTPVLAGTRALPVLVGPLLLAGCWAARDAARVFVPGGDLPAPDRTALWGLLLAGAAFLLLVAAFQDHRAVPPRG